MISGIKTSGTERDEWGAIYARFELETDSTAHIVVSQNKAGDQPKISWYGTSGTIKEAQENLMLMATAIGFAATLEGAHPYNHEKAAA